MPCIASERYTAMKALRTYLVSALAVLLTVTSLTACGTTLETGENGLYDKKHDVAYRNASTVYEATALVKEYGTMKITKEESCKLYTIPGMDGTEMLATEDFNIVYAADITMPTLMEMAPTILHICADGESAIHELYRMEDATDIFTLVYAYTHDDSLPYPATMPLRNYKLRFESTNYPGFYYTLTYIEYAEDMVIDGVNHGKYFLRSAFDDRFVPVSDVVHTAMGLE